MNGTDTVDALKAGKDELAVMGERGAEFINRERGWGAIARKTAAIYGRLSSDEASTRISAPAVPNAAKDIETTAGSATNRRASTD